MQKKDLNEKLQLNELSDILLPLNYLVRNTHDMWD